VRRDFGQQRGCRRSGSSSSNVWLRLRRDPRLLIGVIILAIVLLVAIFAPLIAPHDPYEIHEEGSVSLSILRRPEPTECDSVSGNRLPNNRSQVCVTCQPTGLGRISHMGPEDRGEVRG